MYASLLEGNNEKGRLSFVMNRTMQRKYARLLVRAGVHVQKGQTLLVRAQTEIYPFVELLADEAYKAGAGDVQVEWGNQTLSRLEYRHRTLTALSDVRPWQEAKLKEQAETLPAAIRLYSEDPDGLRGVNQEKLKKVRQKRYPILKPYQEQMENRYQWLVAAVPGKAWAQKMFPGVRASVAVERLWQAIFETCLVTKDNDPVAAWEEKDRLLEEKCRVLNAYRFDSLEYRNSLGTDFRCRLMPQSLWCAGGERTLGGVFFHPNMPTEEVFTTPMKGHCDGRLVASKPLSYQGTLIEDFYIDYRDGKAVAWDARVGRQALDSILQSDEGSLMLGELALVPFDSPISRQNLLYYCTLFDENASCHAAIGRGYTNCVEGFENMSKEQLRDLGVNDSQVHVDFMIGTPDLTVTGWKDGKATVIFRNGAWAL